MRIASINKYIFAIIGLALLTGCVYLYSDKQAFKKKAEISQGVVVELIIERFDKTIMYAPIISFTTKEGDKIEFTSAIGNNSPSYRVGETVEIIYDPKEPNKADINSFTSLWMAPLILGVFGIIFFLIGFSIFLHEMNDKLKEK